MDPIVIFIIVSTVFVKGGTFLSLPFLTVYLQKHLQVSAAMTGLVVGLNPLASMIVGFGGGYVSDRSGRKAVLIVSAFLCSFAYLGFSIATELWQFAALSFLVGATGGSMQSSLKALLADLAVGEQKHLAFRLQYFAINVGASVGPLIGAKLLLSDSGLGFVITGSLYFVFVFCFLFFDFFLGRKKSGKKRKKFSRPENIPSFSECVTILRKDTRFLYFLLGSILMSLTYSQIDTLLPSHLRRIMGNPGVTVFAGLLALNSVTVILGLFPVTWVAKRIGPFPSIVAGQLLMSVGFGLIAYVGTSIYLLVVCTFLLTLGEIIAFSNTSIIIDSFARDDLKGAYFGAANFYLLGNAVGPFLGGALFEFGGSRFAFTLLGLISALGVLAYRTASGPKTMAP